VRAYHDRWLRVVAHEIKPRTLMGYRQHRLQSYQPWAACECASSTGGTIKTSESTTSDTPSRAC